MAENQKLDLVTDDELSPDELVRLFSALEDMRADDNLKSATIARIFGKATAVSEPAGNCEAAADDASDNESTGQCASIATNKTVAESASGTPDANNTRKSWRQKVRVIRIMAIAACLALALAGGAAYALPSAHVQISNSTSSIDMGINRFGIVVTTNTDDEELRPLLQSESINVPADEALNKACSLLEKADPNSPVEFNVETADAGQREHLESKGREITEHHHTETADDNAPAGAPEQNAAPEAPTAPPSDSAQGQLSETATPNAGNSAKVENNNAPAQDDQARRSETPNLDGQNSQGSQGSSPESQRESQASLNNAPSNPSGDKPGYNRPNGNAPEGPSPTQQPQQPPSPSSGDPNPADRNKS